MEYLPSYELSTLPALHQAAGGGNTDELLRLLTEGADIEAPADTFNSDRDDSKRGLTPLMVAACSTDGSAEAVAALLARGADPRARSAAGAEPLWYAAAGGDPARVQALLDASGDPGATTADGRTALLMAAYATSADVVRLLLKAGASPHLSGGFTDYASAAGHLIPLFAAAETGNAIMVQMLLDLGAPAAARDGDGRTPLMAAASPEVVRLLLAAGCPLEARDSAGQTALHAVLANSYKVYRIAEVEAYRAAREAGLKIVDLGPAGEAMHRNHLTMVSMLLDAGADLEANDEQGQTPLLAVCGRPNVTSALVDLLLARGANVGARDHKGRTVLHSAAGNHSYPADLAAIVGRLAAAGADVDARDDVGRTSLHLAVGKASGDRTVIHALLNLGADIEACDGDGHTPLMLLAEVAQVAPMLARLLLDHGADTGARALDGRSAADIIAAAVIDLERRSKAQAAEEDEPTQAVREAAELRLRARALRLALPLLGEPMLSLPPAPAPPTLPAPLWLGYECRHWRVRPHEGMWGEALGLGHISEVWTFGHKVCYFERNLAGCFPTEEHAREQYQWLLAADEGERARATEPEVVLATRAYPLSFESSGETRPLTLDELVGKNVEMPQAPDLGAFERLGYDVTQFNPRWEWPGCSPLSPFCNGMAAGFGALVNRDCLVDDLATAVDLALLFAVTQPEPAPYIIVEVWRRITSDIKAGDDLVADIPAAH